MLSDVVVRAVKDGVDLKTESSEIKRRLASAREQLGY